MKRIFFIALFTLLYLVPLNGYAACVINMTYKDGDKQPLIAKAPDNSGAYFDLFTKAAEKIDCTLKVDRMSKKRLHKMLTAGKLDFYPGASFSKKRADYLYYIKNGFETGEIGMTRIEVAELTDLQQLKALSPLWMMELGSSKKGIAKELGIEAHLMPSITIDTAVKMLSHKRADFFVADKEPLDYFLKEDGHSSYEELGVKLHQNCCGGIQPMYLGFSRFSPHFSEKDNPAYDSAQPISPENFPTLVDENCVAYKFGQALLELQRNGETQKIYNKHFLGN